MNINWRAKSAAFGVVDRLGLHKTLYFAQKYVTGRSRVKIREIRDNWLIHRDNLASLEAPRIIEFGAGKSLQQNIYLSRYLGEQIAVDLFPMLDISMFNDSARQIAALEPSIPYRPCADVAEIEANYRIRYIAPLDIRRTDWQDDICDGCISTNTCEHIGRDDLVAIFTEIRRLVRDGGLISAVIDYSDHYAHTDRAIGRLNYLSYSADEFARFNHAVHYQNRLRHYDYRAIFQDLGLDIVSETALDFAEPPGRVSEEFDTDDATCNATKGVFLLRVKKAGC